MNVLYIKHTSALDEGWELTEFLDGIKLSG